MRAVVQRVSESSVRVEGEIVGKIGRGLLILLGVETGDTAEDAAYMARKIGGLRIFNDDAGLFNLSLAEVNGEVLVISQFTLLGDCRKGRRPSFIHAAQPEEAVPLYEAVIQHLGDQGFRVESGTFGAHMDVHLVNDGPVTLLIDSKKQF
ncbi:MAG: D-tyrosyl-tRNA(Tyr) deacylase [Candidatus Hydrogenedentes bacterium]|nr:D-tyrosyl-tRNA(Tyr) deacylase [Candidatus Hydrogenedentota bacterium]